MPKSRVPERHSDKSHYTHVVVDVHVTTTVLGVPAKPLIEKGEFIGLEYLDRGTTYTVDPADIVILKERGTDKKTGWGVYDLTIALHTRTAEFPFSSAEYRESTGMFRIVRTYDEAVFYVPAGRAVFLKKKVAR